MKRLVRRILVLVGLSASACAHAQLSYPADLWWDNRWYVAPFVQFTFPDSARLARDGTGFGIAAGKALAPSWDVEVRGAYEELPAQGAPDNWHNWTLEANGKWYFLGRQGRASWDEFQPYAIAGLGLINDSVGASKTSVTANAGLGVTLALGKWARFFIDGRYRWDANSGKLVSQNSFGDWVLNVGVLIPIGTAPAVTESAARPSAASPPPPPPPPATAPVAAASPVSPPPPPPPPVPMAKRGPPKHTFDLSADGMFAYDKATLTPVGESRIENMIEGMRQAGVTGLTSMTIIGHTDPLGAPAYNQALSLQRANAIKTYLVGRGIPAGIITTEGRGETQLKITEEECRAKGQGSPRSALIACLAPDRRVEIIATVTGGAQ
ncbi:MAG TPA: OmpA family protein [Burkholderiaceae bacterium]|nr:OmpA family protein [Burkholderiaceae bacterium]